MARINAVETLDADSPTFAADVHGFAVTLTGPVQSLADRFWDNNAIELLTGCLGYLCAHCPPDKRNLFELRDFLCDIDLDYRIAQALDEGRIVPGSFIDQAFKNYLGHERDKVRTSVRSTAVQHLTSFAGDHVRGVISSTSFDFQDVVAGRPQAIFLVIPPHRLESSASLLRLIVSTLIGLLSRRKVAPVLPTLVILDELAQLGAFPLLRPLITLMRGYGARAMLMLQDASQLRQLYPNDYATIVNNCSILSTFGHGSFSMSRELADLMGDVTAEQLFDMGRDSMAVRLNGQRTRILKRLNYLTDPLFAGLYGNNPMAPARLHADAAAHR